jgi:hypothetical protein
MHIDGTKIGKCQRFPPVMLPVHMAESLPFNIAVVPATDHPQSGAYDWCGEFQATRNVEGDAVQFGREDGREVLEREACAKLIEVSGVSFPVNQEISDFEIRAIAMARRQFASLIRNRDQKGGS